MGEEKIKEIPETDMKIKDIPETGKKIKDILETGMKIKGIPETGMKIKDIPETDMVIPSTTEVNRVVGIMVATMERQEEKIIKDIPETEMDAGKFLVPQTGLNRVGLIGVPVTNNIRSTCSIKKLANQA